MLTDATAHRTILLENGGCFHAQCIENGARVADSRLGAAQHARHRPREVDRCWPRAADGPRKVARRVAQLRRAVISLARERDYEAHRARDTDGGCAPDGERANRIAHLVEGSEVSLDQARGQLALVDDAHAETIAGPPYRSDDVHEDKVTRAAWAPAASVQRRLTKSAIVEGI